MPQGSWLGPLSFLVLIDDLDVDCLIHKYVDDTTLTEPLCVQHQPTNMELFFHQLQVWANNNDMVVNFNKTKQNITPTTPSALCRSHRTRQLSKIAGHQLGCNIIIYHLIITWILRGSHTLMPSRLSNSETIFSKTTQTGGCSPGSVAVFLYRGNQTCTGICGPGLESLAQENWNWPKWSDTKASPQDHLQLY